MMYGWQRYLGLEKDFLDAEFYVSLDQTDVYSEFFTREIILLGVEIEAAFKELCKRLNGSKPGNIAQYKEIILGNLPNLPNTSVLYNGKHYYPFKGWDTGKLYWWSVYTDLKHNLVDKQATLGIAMTMLQAYELLLFCVCAVRGNVVLDLKDEPKLFEVGFITHAGAVTVDMKFTKIYIREDILEQLGFEQNVCAI